MITNTKKQADEIPVHPLIMASAMGVSGAIEVQEAQGQRELVNSQQMPTDGSEDPRWAVMGVVFGPPTPDDPIFRSVTLPLGWKFEASGHSMWSSLVDDKGRERAGIFYKAAFYDRSAHVGITNRFSVKRKYPDIDAKGLRILQHTACDCDVDLFSTGAILNPTSDRSNQDWSKYNRINEEQEAECREWLDNNRPGWTDYAKSWEIE